MYPEEFAVSAESFTEALSRFATGVTILSVRDDADDVAIVATSFTSVSLRPPQIVVSLGDATYFYEVMQRQDLWAASILAGGQERLAGRFTASGRPSPRHLLDDTGHHRGTHSQALIIDSGLAGLECRTVQRVTAGDHMLVVAEVIAVDYVSDSTSALLRFHHKYLKPSL